MVVLPRRGYRIVLGVAASPGQHGVPSSGRHRSLDGGIAGQHRLGRRPAIAHGGASPGNIALGRAPSSGKAATSLDNMPLGMARTPAGATICGVTMYTKVS